MMIEEVREYWCRRLERAENYSDEHWDADERHEHADYIDAMKCAITALTVCIEHKNPKSNADRIRQMTDEELAELMTYVDTNICDFCASRHSNTYYDCEEESCEKCVLAWLKQEVSEDAR